jgi:hypothetical protein
MPDGQAIVIPNDRITDYENAMGEIKREHVIEAELKGALSLTKEFDLNQIITNFPEYAPYRDILLKLLELEKQTGGKALVKDALKKFAREKWLRSREVIQAQFKLPAGKERQRFAYDPLTLAF